MIASPARTTLPGELNSLRTTMPSTGARMTVRDSTSSAARICSSTSDIEARTVFSSLTASSTRPVVSRSICCFASTCCVAELAICD